LSSNHHPIPLSGVVTHRGIPVGGLAIPLDTAEEFIEAFRLKYQSLGLDASLLGGNRVSHKLPISPDRQTEGIQHDPDF